MLIGDEGIDALLAEEDAAILAAENPTLLVDGDTVTAEPGTPLADLIEVLNNEGQEDTDGPTS